MDPGPKTFPSLLVLFLSCWDRCRLLESIFPWQGSGIGGGKGEVIGRRRGRLEEALIRMNLNLENGFFLSFLLGEEANRGQD